MEFFFMLPLAIIGKTNISFQQKHCFLSEHWARGAFSLTKKMNLSHANLLETIEQNLAHKTNLSPYKM